MALFRRKTPGGVTEQAPASSEPGPTPVLHAGTPGRCPECDGFGYIDNIDMRNRIQTQHCRTCNHMWEFSFDEAGDVIDLTEPALERSRSSPSASG